VRAQHGRGNCALQTQGPLLISAVQTRSRAWHGILLYPDSVCQILQMCLMPQADASRCCRRTAEHRLQAHQTLRALGEVPGDAPCRRRSRRASLPAPTSGTHTSVSSVRTAADASPGRRATRTCRALALSGAASRRSRPRSPVRRRAAEMRRRRGCAGSAPLPPSARLAAATSVGIKRQTSVDDACQLVRTLCSDTVFKAWAYAITSNMLLRLKMPCVDMPTRQYRRRSAAHRPPQSSEMRATCGAPRRSRWGSRRRARSPRRSRRGRRQMHPAPRA
jgi:hypothetical protein